MGSCSCTRANSCQRSQGSFSPCRHTGRQTRLRFGSSSHLGEPFPSGISDHFIMARHLALGQTPLHSGCCNTCLAAPFGCSVVYWCFFFSKLNKLEQLEELNLSGNKLKTIPTTIANCKRLHTLVAHSNNISIFPEILQLPQIQVLSCAGMLSLWGSGRRVNEVDLVRKKDVAVRDHSIFSGFLGRN